MKTLVQLYLNSYRGLSKPVWMLAFIMLINRSGAMVIPFLSVYMIQSLHFGLKDTGIVLSCFGFGAVSGSWLGGWLSDKCGHYTIQLVTLLICIPVFCALPELRTPVLLSGGVFILGMITETFRPANSVAIASYTSPENITKAFSLNRMAINLGFSIGPALGGFLAAFSYQWLFYGNALSSAVAGFVFYLFFRNIHNSTTKIEQSSVKAEHAQNLSPWKDRYFILFTLLCTIYGICFFQLLSTIPIFYRQVHSLIEWQIGLILAFSGLVVFLLEMLLVHIAEKRSKPSTVIITGTLICGISFLILLLPGKYFVLYTSIFLICISEILALPFMSTVAIKRASTGNRGAYMGMNSIAFSAAHIVSPFVGTLVAEVYGFNTLWTATAVVCGLTALGFLFVMKKL